YREEPIAAALASAAAATATFDFTLEGVGAFPSRNSARVVWVGVTAGREEVVELSGRVSEALARIGFPPEPHEFVPHVTLFRVRSRVERRRARELLEGSVPAPGPRTVHVTELFLKESSLTPQGPVHRTRGNFPLRGGPASVG
ncbi:MAG: RNA 2',3'-cyclic phosphodiesterase, partial [Thermoplasmata archaeon]